MRALVISTMCAGALAAQEARWGEVRLAVGAFMLGGGSDAQIQARLGESAWMVGYKFVQWTDIGKDPFTGRRLTKSLQTMKGPTVTYLFRPHSPHSWTLGAEVLRWSRKETSLMTGEANSDATTALFFGGGILWTWGPIHCQLGIYLAPGATLNTQTSVSSEESTGGFDIQAHLGWRF